MTNSGSRKAGWELFIFARFHAREGSELAIAAAMRAMLPPVRAEPGCLGIEVFQSTSDPRHFYLHSRWVDEAAFDEHAKLPHTKRFIEAIEPLIDHALEVARVRRLADDEVNRNL